MSVTRLLVVMCLWLCVVASARGEIALVVGAHSGAITAVSREEAEQLYLGRLSALRDGTPVRLLDLAAGSTRDAFYRALIGKNPIQTRAYWSRIVFTGRARPPREVAGAEQLRHALSLDPNLIGYLPADQVSDDLRVLLTLD